MKATYEKVIIGCGVWLLVLSFTGFPRSWKTILTVVTGVVVIYFGALLYKKTRTLSRAAHKDTETKTQTFTETITSE